MEKVNTHLGAIERKLGKANKIAEKREKLSLKDAIKLGRKSNSIVSTVKKTIKDLEATNLTHDQHKEILAQMTQIVDMTEKQLDLLVQLKPHLEKLHVGGLVKKTMNKSDAVSKDLEKLMLEKSPEDLKSQAKELGTRREVAFDKATAAFANSVGGEDEAEGEDDSD